LPPSACTARASHASSKKPSISSATSKEERRRLERRQLTDAAELFIRHQHKGLPWEPALDFSEQAGFVFSKQQIERHARDLMRQNPTYYAAHPRSQAVPPPKPHVENASRTVRPAAL
jgi:hypothetical protein